MRRPGSGAGRPASMLGSGLGEALGGGPGPAGGAGGAAARGQGRGDRKPVAAGSMRTARRSAGPAGSGLGPGRAWRCLDLLRCARASGSPAFLSMNACLLPGGASPTAPPLPGGESPRGHAPHRAGVIAAPPPAPRGPASRASRPRLPRREAPPPADVSQPRGAGVCCRLSPADLALAMAHPCG